MRGPLPCGAWETNDMNTTFLDYLAGVHAKDYHGTDDDMPDDFKRWMDGLDSDDLIALAEEAIREKDDYIREIMVNTKKLYTLADESIAELKKIKEMLKK